MREYVAEDRCPDPNGCIGCAEGVPDHDCLNARIATLKAERDALKQELREAKWALAGARIEHAELESRLAGMRDSRDELDRLVCEFCKATGEPVPVDALDSARALREAAARVGGLTERQIEALRGRILHSLDMAYGPDRHNDKVADALIGHIVALRIGEFGEFGGKNKDG